MQEEIIFLGSSNYTKEYLLDVLEVIGRPRGHVMHFRYRKDWVEPKLWKKILPRSESKRSPLIGLPILTAFIYQKMTGQDHETKWGFAYPIRLCKLIDCFKTGDGKYDIAFFFFELCEYCLVHKIPEEDEKLLNSFYSEINQKLPTPHEHPNIHYSAAICQIDNLEVSTDPDDSAFHNTAGRLRIEHFESPDGRIQYYPTFVQVHNFSDSLFKPFDSDLERRYYEFTEGYNYDLRINTFFRKTPPSSISLNISCPEKQFIYPISSSEQLQSAYDEFTWRIVPARVPKDTFTTLGVSITANPPVFLLDAERKGEILNLDLSVPILLRFNRRFRIIETLEDIGLALASILIALTGLLQKTIPDNPILNWLLVGAGLLYLLGVGFKIYSQWVGK